MESVSTDSQTPVFDNSKVVVIFVLGGPGAGKGTQCARLLQDYAFVHLSAGDLLRAEQHRAGSQYGEMIRTCIREGTIVPMEITVKLLENAMRDALRKNNGHDAWKDGKGLFLIDGFPRKMDQAIKFEADVCVSSLVLHFACTEDVMLNRLLERAKTSGREDDNVESIKKRFVTHQEQTKPVIDYYRKISKVAEIDSSRTIDEIYIDASKAIDVVLQGKK